MKTLITLLFILTFFACKKENPQPDCKTCTLDVVYTSNVGGMQQYVAESKEVCDESWTSINGRLDPNSGSGTNGDVHWTRTMIWHCK